MVDKISNEQIYAVLLDIQQQNACIKNDVDLIKQTVSDHFLEIKQLKSKVENLEAENTFLRKQVEFLDRKSRSNSLVVFGFENNDQDVFLLIDKLCNFFKDRMNVVLERNEINKIHFIGGDSKDNNRPIKLELVRNLKKIEILRNVRKLKGTRVTISEDLNTEDRNRSRLLYQHYKAAIAGNYPAKLTKTAVIINGKKYVYEDLKDTELLTSPGKANKLARKSVSAPSSPKHQGGQGTRTNNANLEQLVESLSYRTDPGNLKEIIDKSESVVTRSRKTSKSSNR